MIKSLKLSALALVLSITTFQAQAGSCNKSINTKDLAVLKECGDKPGLDILDAGNAVFFKEKCATVKGKDFSPACKQGSKMLAKGGFSILELAKMGAGSHIDAKKAQKAQNTAKDIVGKMKKLDKMNLGGKAGSSAKGKSAGACTSKMNTSDLAKLKECADHPGLEVFDAGGAAFLKNNCKMQKGKEFTKPCQYGSKMLAKAMYAVFELGKSGTLTDGTLDKPKLAKAAVIAKQIVASLKKLDGMNLGEIGAAKHVSSKKAKKEAPAEDAAPAEGGSEAAPAPVEEAPAAPVEEAPAE
jgi:hypothetical protein